MELDYIYKKGIKYKLVDTSARKEAKVLKKKFDDTEKLIPVFKEKTVTVTAQSGVKVYTLGIPVQGANVLSIIALDRFGWDYILTNGVSGAVDADTWCVMFISQPSGTFTFRVLYTERK